MRTIWIILMTLFLVPQVHTVGQNSSFLQGRASMEEGLYNEAVAHFEEALGNNKNDLRSIYQRGICYFEAGNYQAATADFVLVNKKKPGMSTLMLAKTESRLGRTHLAVKYLREHLQSSYRLPEKELLMDPDMIALEDTPEWLGLWREKDWYSRFDKELAEARYLKQTEEYMSAINLLEDLEKRGMYPGEVRFLLGDIYKELGNARSAKRYLQGALKYDMRNKALLESYIDLLEVTDEMEEALKRSNDLLRFHPDEFKHYLINARLNAEAGSYEKGLERLNTYIELFPQNPEAYHLIGVIHMKQGNYIKALTNLNRVLELDTGVAAYYHDRGLAYAATGTYRYAARDFSMALDLDPKAGQTWFEKGKAELELGNKSTACFNFRKAYQYGVYEAGPMYEKICGLLEPINTQ